ncbi:MAG: thaumatin family protein [Pseudomonadota bacterium]
MASPNQGTPTCFTDVDCPVGRPTCVTSGFGTGVDVPEGSGVCLNVAQDGVANSYRDAAVTCSAGSVGQPCSGLNIIGFEDGLGYTCQPVQYTTNGNLRQTAYTCLAPTTDGLGSCQTAGGLSLYSGGGGVFNEAWLTAAKVAGDGEKGFHEIFKDACPRAYSWQYDDIAADYGCESDLSSFEVTFCPMEMDVVDVDSPNGEGRPLLQLLRRLSPEDRTYLRGIFRERIEELLANRP